MQQGIFPLVLITSVTGLVSGVYVYFATLDTIAPIPEPEAEAVSFEITADDYGYCQTRGGCVSYHIEKDGSYTHIIYRNDGPERVEGVLPEQQRTILVSDLRNTDFSRISKNATTCSRSQDTATRYMVRIGTETHTFDTCTDGMSGDLMQGLETFKNTRIWSR